MARTSGAGAGALPDDGRLRALLREGLAELGVEQGLAAALLGYLGELRQWNAAYNLTAVREPSAMIVRHLLDSLSVLPYVRSPLLDLGSGAGLPGIPLALVQPSLAVTLLDSNGKKARFLRHALRVLALPNAQVVQERAEAYRPPAPFACVISRAFGNLAEFLRLSAALPAADGQWLAMKGKLDREELRQLPAGVRVVDIKSLHVPGLAEERHLVILERI